MFIQNVKISGFRSLLDVTVGNLKGVNILYGENNAGKSNILAALELLFFVERPEELNSKTSGFVRGEYSNFVDNFSIDSKGIKANKIIIKARICLDDEDLNRIPFFRDFIRKHDIYQTGHTQKIELEALFAPLGQNKATKTITIAKVNKTLMYHFKLPETKRFFPKLMGPLESRQNSTEELFGYLTNSFKLVRAERFLREEHLEARPVLKISAELFKNWLLSVSNSRGKEHEIFEKIVDWFNEKPFEYGTIRPFVESEKVGIIVKDNKSERELIIDRLGTGIQQVLMLFANLATSTARIVAIEEVESNMSPSLQNRLVTMLKTNIGKDNVGIDQLFLTSHSLHLSKRHDVQLYAAELDDAGMTNVASGPTAVNKISQHFDYGLIKFAKNKVWR